MSNLAQNIVDFGLLCNKCKETKPLDRFQNDNRRQFIKRHGKLTICKDCRNSMNRSNKSHIASKQKERRLRVGHRYRKFGLSAETFKTLYDAQNGKCGICKTNLDFYAKTTCIDHDHSTGKIREILCGKCNLGLGHFADNIEVMQAAIAYLEKHRE